MTLNRVDAGVKVPRQALAAVVDARRDSTLGRSTVPSAMGEESQCASFLVRTCPYPAWE